MDELVGFRFHPTEEEIILYFLERKMRGLDFPVHTIAEVDVCKFEPGDLPNRSPLPPDDQVWYFFHAPVYKYARSKRTDRTTATGFWKVTGDDRPIWDKQGTKEIGFKKNLVFHTGRSRNGIRTKWVIHEYHSNNATSYQKEYVLCRLKRKSGDKSDICNEANRHSASDPGNYVAAAPQVDNDLSEELKSILDNNGPDCISLSALLSRIQPHPGTSYSNGFGNQYNLANSQLELPEQDNAFVDSLWADQDEFPGGISVHISKSLGKTYIGGNSDMDTELLYAPVQELQCNFFNGNTSSKENRQKPMVRLSYETSSSSDGEWYKAESGFLHEIVDSDTDMPAINCLELVDDEFPANTRACKSQHTPKSLSFVEKKCAPQERHSQSKALSAAVSKVKAREAAVRAVDIPKTENSAVKFVKDLKMAQTSNGKASLKFPSNNSDRNNRNGSFIFLETPPLEHKNYPPSVYLGNVLVSLVLIIFFIREMVCLR